MAITLDQIKELREITGVSTMMCKKALEETDGDIAKAIDVLRKKGATSERAAKANGEFPKQGVIHSYIHSNGKMGALVHIGCETDFVANNADFQEFVRDVAMQIAAMNPLYINPENVPNELVEKEREIWKGQLAQEKKPEAVLAKIMEGKEKKFREEVSLTTMPFVKDSTKTIADLLNDMRVKMGENIQICRFVRYAI